MRIESIDGSDVMSQINHKAEKVMSRWPRFVKISDCSSVFGIIIPILNSESRAAKCGLSIPVNPRTKTSLCAICDLSRCCLNLTELNLADFRLDARPFGGES